MLDSKLVVEVLSIVRVAATVEHDGVVAEVCVLGAEVNDMGTLYQTITNIFHMHNG